MNKRRTLNTLQDVLISELNQIDGIVVASESVLLGDTGTLISFEHWGTEFQLHLQYLERGERSQIRGLLDSASVLTRKKVATVVASEYFSRAARTMLREGSVGYIDLEGNVFLSIGTIHIQIEVPARRKITRKFSQSLYSPKASQVLRVLLSHSEHAWKVRDLARNARVSLGLASNVRSTLLEREWARETDFGLLLSDRDSLLNEWREIYKPTVSPAMFHTLLPGTECMNVLKGHLGCEEPSRALLASYSAAGQLAPYARHPIIHLYAEDAVLPLLIDLLELQRVDYGATLHVNVTGSAAPYLGCVELPSGLAVTSPVQTYLDLWNAGERGREAAEVLRDRLL